jgi:Single-strand binding protein family
MPRDGTTPEATVSGGIWDLVSGTLGRDPERRIGQRREFATATIRVGHADGAQWVNILAFAEVADRLLGLHKGDGASVAGRLELRTWRSQEGAQHTSLTIIAGEIAAVRQGRALACAHVAPQPRRAYRLMHDGGAELPPLGNRNDDLWPAAADSP